MDELVPYFVDQSSIIDKFWDDIERYSLKRWLKAFSFNKLLSGSPKREEPIVVPNVLCPWRSLELCFYVVKINLGNIIQRHLTKV